MTRKTCNLSILKCRTLAFALATSIVFAGPTYAATNDMNRITQNLCALILEASPLQKSSDAAIHSPENWLNTMKPDGSWPDQDYKDRDRLHWKAGEHLPRLLAITKLYYSTGNPLSGKSTVLARINVSLRFWLEKDPKNENWWHNEIGVPQQIGQLLILMGRDAPADVRAAGIELMKRSKWQKQTGANLTDETIIQIMRGCLAQSPELISEAFARSWEEVKIANVGEDGIQADNSFHQHGPLLYNYGYGSDFASDIVKLVAMAHGTDVPVPADKVAIFNGYMLDGTRWMARGGKLDWGACGRGICRPGRLNGGPGGGLGIYEKMALCPGPRQSEMAAAAELLKAGDDKSEPVGNRQFWRSDFMVQRRPNYYASMRMYSDRTLNTDGLINGENRKSHHIGDGATCLMVSGDEYFNIFPVWDWRKIPGTTIEQNTPMEETNNAIHHSGKARFVGGVSDGNFGCSTMDLDVGPLRASKAWFCFDDQIVCLGAGITCPASNPVLTTLNQCLLHGPVVTAAGEAARGDHDLKNTAWVWHDSIGYVLPEGANVHLKNAPQSGRWSDIGTGPEAEITENIFSLWIDHGTLAHDASYEYMLMPGADAKRTAAEAATPQIKVVSNTPALQAVWHEGLQLLEAVCHSPGEITAEGTRIAVDQPCLLMVQKIGGKKRVTVSNPLNAPMAVRVSIDGMPVIIELPRGLAAGSSVVRDVK